MNNFENNNIINKGGEGSVPQAPQTPLPQPVYPQGVPSMPQLQLTPEQIAALLGQLVIIQPAPQPQAQQTQEPLPLPEAQTPKAQNNPGTRILFQSDDFDEKSQSFDNNALSESIDEALKKKNIYDDEALFSERLEELPGISKKKTASNIKTTDFGDDFNIAEVELSKDVLPKSRTKKPTEEEKTEEKPSGPVVEIEEETFSLSKKTEKKKPFMEVEEISVEIPTEEERTKKKKLPVSEIIRRSVLGISLAAIVISSAVLVREFKLHKDNENLEAEISNLIVSEAETTKKSSDKKDKDKNKDKNNKEEGTTALTPEMQWQELREEFPKVIFPPGLQLKYARLFATNQDFVGYLSADGIDMALPIVQTNNDEKYMKKNFYGQTTKYGCPFVTHLNNITELDMNTVIFGHHMNDGTVFGILDKYKSIEGFKAAPVISFNTLYKDYQWKIIAAFITNAYEKEDNGYVFQYYFTSLSTQERFSAFLNELSQRSLYDTGVDVLPSDKILTLSTCSHEFNEARFVVVARLVRPGESTEVDTASAVVNPSPRYPQAFYDKKKTDNPYKNAQKWYVG